MNERIKLPAQEWLGHDPEEGDIHGYTFEQMREFAELIVMECADLFEVEWGEEKLTGHDVGYVVKKHFGIEEPEDSACPLCGEDGGTSCGMPGCQY